MTVSRCEGVGFFNLIATAHILLLAGECTLSTDAPAGVLA